MKDRTTRNAQQRDAAASARNARPVVAAGSPASTPMDRHWQAIARQLFDQGREERDVFKALTGSTVPLVLPEDQR